MVAIGGLLFNGGASGNELGIDVAGGVEAEVSDLDEATWQDVEEESANEFEGCEPAGLAVAGEEDDVVVVDVTEAMVGDGDPVSVLAEIAKERIGLVE